MRRLPPLHTLSAFEAAARHGSFALAADELSLTPSAISHQIRSLETHLNQPLFRRLTRRVELNEAGRAFLPFVRTALDELQRGAEALQVQQSAPILTISLAPAFASGWLLPRLPDFQLQHPDIEVRIASSLKLVDFEASDVDLVIRYGQGDWPGLELVHLMREELVPVCSPDYRINGRPIQTLADLHKATLIQSLPKLGDWRNWLKAAGVPHPDPEAGPKFHNSSLAIEAAQAGLGIAIANRNLVGRELDSGRLRIPFDVHLGSEFGYYLAYPKARTAWPKIHYFRHWLTELTQRQDTSPE